MSNNIYDTPYHDPNKIEIKLENSSSDVKYFITRYNWDNDVSNMSPYKTVINVKFPKMDVRQKETICLYAQYMMFSHNDINRLPKPIPIIDQLLTNLYKKYEEKVERIKLDGSSYKYFNPLTNYIEYKLDDNSFVQTKDTVTPLKDYNPKVDILDMVDNKYFVNSCMPQEKRNQKLDDVLGELEEKSEEKP